MDMEQKVEQRAKAIYTELRPFGRTVCEWPRGLGPETLKGYRAIARAELEREGRLVDGLRSLPWSWAYDLVAAYDAEFAPKPRTVEQAQQRVNDAVKAYRDAFVDGGIGSRYMRYEKELCAAYDELAAALGKDGK